MKKYKILGKQMPVFVLVALALMAGTASAALLTYYGQITTTVDVQQSILLDGGDHLQINVDVVEEDAPGGEEFCFKHHIKNQMSVPGEVELETIYDPNGGGITTTYDSEITDITAYPITDFGSRNNEVCGKIYKYHTLDEIFSGTGLQYGYTVVDGGTYNGASPIVAVLDLDDGRHIALFPGWGARADDTSHSLQFSGTVATATADGGSVPVDFALYPSDFSSWLYGSGPSYGDFEAIKADTVLLNGSEVVVSISFQHQAANTGETDRLDWMDIEFGDERNDFVQPEELVPFWIESGEEVSFCLCHQFPVNIPPNTYEITTEVIPVV